MKNIDELKALYLNCFTEDTAEDADHLFNEVFSKAQLISIEEKGQTISMLFLMNCSLICNKEDIPYYYLYAACTHPDHRGKGLMGELLAKARQFAKEKGKQGIILKPAQPSLFNFYEKYGFKPFFRCSKAFLSAKDFKTDKTISLTHISLEQWWEKRKILLKDFSDCFVSFPKELFTAAVADCRVATDRKGAYVVYEVRDSLLLCKECIFEKGADSGIIPLAYTLLKENNLKTAELRFPINDSKILNSVAKEDFFSVISEDNAEASQPYHGFAFD